MLLKWEEGFSSMADYKTNNSTLRTRRRQAEVCKRRYQVDLGQIRLNFSTQALITSQTNPRFVCFSYFTDLNAYNLRGEEDGRLGQMYSKSVMDWIELDGRRGWGRGNLFKVSFPPKYLHTVLSHLARHYVQTDPIFFPIFPPKRAISIKALAPAVCNFRPSYSPTPPDSGTASLSFASPRKRERSARRRPGQERCRIHIYGHVRSRACTPASKPSTAMFASIKAPDHPRLQTRNDALYCVILSFFLPPTGPPQFPFFSFLYGSFQYPCNSIVVPMPSCPREASNSITRSLFLALKGEKKTSPLPPPQEKTKKPKRKSKKKNNKEK